MLRRTIQTNHSNVVIFCPNIQHGCLNVLCLNFDFFIVTDIIFNYYCTSASGCISVLCCV
jgi:hypothetical protein